jgi:hypothetical protein
VVQPGVLDLVCLNPESGRLHWQKAIAGLRRLAGLTDRGLVVETEAGFMCLEAATGKEVWRHAAQQVLSSLCGGPGGLMYCRAEAIPGENELRRSTLVWVDLQTGRERARYPLGGPGHAKPRLGPLFVAGDRLWAFSGRGNDLTRDFLELVPKAQGLSTTEPATPWDVWTPTVSAPLRAAAAQVLPGWTVLDSKPHARTGLMDEYQGKRSVLCAAAAFVAGRHLDVPTTGKPRLLLHLAGEAKGQCTIAVDIDGKRVWHQEVTGEQWKDWEVDLSAFKGQRPWVLVRQLAKDGETTCSYWGKIEVKE